MNNAMQSIDFEAGSKQWHEHRHRARTDLYWLNSVVRELSDKIPMTLRAHYALCKFASRTTGNKAIDECRVQVIECPRGLGKSAIVTQGRTIQRILQNQDWSAIIANEAKAKSEAFLSAIKVEFENNDYLRFLFPEIIPNFSKTTWTSDKILVARTKKNTDRVNPTVMALGVGSQSAGAHANEIIVDDLISEEAAENAMAGHFTLIERANRWVTRLNPLLKFPNRDPLTFVCTPWYLDDTYQFILDTYGGIVEDEDFYEEADEIVWQLRLPDGTDQRITLYQKGDVALFKLPAVDEDGRAVFPERYDLEELDRLREIDPYFFASQYMLEPNVGGAAEFDPKWLKTYRWENANQIEYRDEYGRIRYDNIDDHIVNISVDPAISRSKKACRTAITITGTNGQEVFLYEAWAKRVGALELAQQIIEFYKQYRPNRVIVELVSYQEALAEILEKLAADQGIGRIPIFEHRTGSNMKKELRIMALEPFFNRGRFYYHPPTQKDFFDEYSNFPHTRMKDILDALSMQKHEWHRASGKGNTRGNPVQEWSKKSRAQADRIRDRYRR